MKSLLISLIIANCIHNQLLTSNASRNLIFQAIPVIQRIITTELTGSITVIQKPPLKETSILIQADSSELLKVLLNDKCCNKEREKAHSIHEQAPFFLNQMINIENSNKFPHSIFDSPLANTLNNMISRHRVLAKYNGYPEEEIFATFGKAAQILHGQRDGQIRCKCDKFGIKRLYSKYY